MTNIKVTFVGAESSGKTSLIKRLVGQDYNSKEEATIGAGFFSLRNEGNGCQIWDTTGAERFKSTVPLYVRSSAVLLYCVDLAHFETMDAENKAKFKKELQSNLDAYKLLDINQEMKIILVGTKADQCKALRTTPDKKIRTPEEILAEIAAGINFDQTIVTSAQDNEGIVSNQVDDKCGLKNVLLSLAEEANVGKKPVEEHFYTKPMTTNFQFPKSYTQMWEKQSGNNCDKALKILADYSKVPNTGANGFFESVISVGKLAVTGHWARSHHKAVEKTIADLHKTGKNDVPKLLQTLYKNLLNEGKKIELEGSLAKRILFIQQRIGNNLIDLDKLNQEIEANNASKNTKP